jgi:hypothetical protein
VSLKSHNCAQTAALAALAARSVWAADVGSGPAEKLAEVTVTARRLDLTPRVEKFVTQIAAAENGGEGLARWQLPPVCPLVSGLPRRDGEFILERVSEIARGAGVPLADEHCHPNLYVLVTDQPEDLLRGMEKRNRAYTFGFDASFYPPIETPAGVVDAFITTPRAVRVWYSSAEKDAWGKPLGYCPASELFSQCVTNPHSPACDPTQYYRCGSAVAGGTHLQFNTLWTFSRVFVIVDSTHLHGVQLGQLADYVAMTGLAKLKPGAQLGDAPTILKLFDGAPRDAPAGLTEWDQTFLKSLYATDQKSHLQRTQIARAMVREIIP